MGQRSRAPPAAFLGRWWGVGGSSSRGDRLRVTWPTSHIGPNRQAGPCISGHHRWPGLLLQSCLSSCAPGQAFALLPGTAQVWAVGACVHVCSIVSHACGRHSTCSRHNHLPGFVGAVRLPLVGVSTSGCGRRRGTGDAARQLRHIATLIVGLAAY